MWLQTCCYKPEMTFQTYSWIPGQDYKVKHGRNQVMMIFSSTYFHPRLGISCRPSQTSSGYTGCLHSEKVKVHNSPQAGLKWGSQGNMAMYKDTPRKPKDSCPEEVNREEPRASGTSHSYPRRMLYDPRLMELSSPASLHPVLPRFPCCQVQN